MLRGTDQTDPFVDYVPGRPPGALRRARASWSRGWSRFWTDVWSRVWAVVLTPRRLLMAGLLTLATVVLACVLAVVAWRAPSPAASDPALGPASGRAALSRAAIAGGPGDRRTPSPERITATPFGSDRPEPAITPRPTRSPADLRRPPLQIPVRGLTRDDLVDSFTDPRSGGRAHHAIDLMAPRGTEVLAAAAGTVERLTTNPLGGKAIFVRVAGHIHYYAHLQRFAPGLEAGQQVEAGQVLGTVGSTGNAEADAPHLHFAIHAVAEEQSWWQGEALNPFLMWKRQATDSR